MDLKELKEFFAKNADELQGATLREGEYIDGEDEYYTLSVFQEKEHLLLVTVLAQPDKSHVQQAVNMMVHGFIVDGIKKLEEERKSVSTLAKILQEFKEQPLKFYTPETTGLLSGFEIKVIESRWQRDGFAVLALSTNDYKDYMAKKTKSG